VNAVLVLLAGVWLYGATLTGLAAEWLSSPDASYGVIVAAVAAAVAWQRRGVFARARATEGPAAPGCGVIVIGLLMYVVGVRAADVFVTRLSLFVVLTGSIWFLAGRAALRAMAAPLLFLLLSIPLPALVINTITLPLQLVASRLAESTLSIASVPVFRDGNLLMLPSTTLEVEEACSGLRSLVSLSALAVVLAWAAESSSVRRALVVASAIPIAVAANGLRIAATGIAAEKWGPPAISGTWHTLTGWVTFVVAVGALIWVQRALRGLSSNRAWPRSEEVAA
jgi:exosortase